MNRRDLIKNIFGIVPVAATTALAASAITLPAPSPSPSIDISPLPVTPWKPLHYYHGWGIWWTGWKDLPNQFEIAGQWIAYVSEQQYLLYSSWPGACGPCPRGGVFDIGFREDQAPYPIVGTPQNELRWMRAKCLDRLYELIDKVGPPPYIPEWQR